MLSFRHSLSLNSTELCPVLLHPSVLHNLLLFFLLCSLLYSSLPSSALLYSMLLFSSLRFGALLFSSLVFSCPTLINNFPHCFLTLLCCTLLFSVPIFFYSTLHWSTLLSPLSPLPLPAPPFSNRLFSYPYSFSSTLLCSSLPFSSLFSRFNYSVLHSKFSSVQVPVFHSILCSTMFYSIVCRSALLFCCCFPHCSSVPNWSSPPDSFSACCILHSFLLYSGLKFMCVLFLRLGPGHFEVLGIGMG